MKVTWIYKLNILIVVFVSFSALCQEKLTKLQKKVKADPEVLVTINSSHTTVFLETWNQNSVDIHAYVEGSGINAVNKEHLLKSWKVESSNSTDEIVINSITGNFYAGEVAVSNSGDIKLWGQATGMSPMIAEMLRPILEKIENNPMPSALTQNLASMDFDHNAYQKNEERYIKQWEDQIKEKFGDESEGVIRNWAKELSAQVTKFDKSETTFQGWEGEQFAQQMQAWASKFSGSVTFTQQTGSNVTIYQYKSTDKVENTERILKVRVPLNARVKFSMRHGALRLPDILKDPVASLSHTSLEAEGITGNKSLIKVAYAPVLVKNWKNGRLVINYVKNCRVQEAVNLKVNSDSSNIFINDLINSASITGSFGAITIAKMSDKFKTLDLAIENSDFKLKLPNVAFNFAYNGTHSRLAIPKSVSVNARKNFGNVFVNGFQQTRNTDKTITIHAKYSDIDLH